MKPVGILRFSPTEGPGHFADFLDRRAIAWSLIALDLGQAPPGPERVADFSGFALMGGPMSANDDLPWIGPVLAMLRAADRADRPCIGHCLGGQLMARAFGGVVTVNPVKEIGWHTVSAETHPIARQWLGDRAGSCTVFQWHADTFSIPPGATRILTGTACANQAYVRGKHLGMQCHVEMTPAMIEQWCIDGAAEVAACAGGSVQPTAEIRAVTSDNLPALRALSDTLYHRWVQGLASA